MDGTSEPDRLGTLIEWVKGPGSSADIQTLSFHIERVVNGVKERILSDVHLQAQAVPDPDVGTMNQLWEEAIDRELRRC